MADQDTTEREYSRLEATLQESHERVHRNDERTQVYVLGGGGSHIVIAVDLDESGTEAIAEEIIAVTATPEEAEARAEAWMDDNPKGIESGSGILKGLTGG